MDYSFTESMSTWRMACRCGSKNCRITIRSIHYLPESLFRKNQKYIQPFLRREYARHKVEVMERRTGHVVVAKRTLRTGEKIFRVSGPVIAYKRPPNHRLGYRWLGVGLNSLVIPEEDNPWSCIRYSCDPNVGLNNAHEVIALRTIKSGQEIVVDGSITEADPRWRMRCSCGAKNCRGTMRSIQFLPPEIYKKYLPYIPSFLQKIYKTQHANYYACPHAILHHVCRSRGMLQKPHRDVFELES